MTKATDLVEVTQADRNGAAEIVARTKALGKASADYQRTIDGRRDDSWQVQFVARQRLAHSAQPQPETARELLADELGWASREECLKWIADVERGVFNKAGSKVPLPVALRAIERALSPRRD